MSIALASLHRTTAAAACFVALLCLSGCASEPLAPAAPKDVDLTGEWQINAGLSDDPSHMQDISPDGAGPRRGRGGRGGRGGGGGGPGGGGGGPFGMPGGAGGPSGGGIGAPELLAASGSTTRAAAGGAGGSDPGSFGIGPSNAPGTGQPNPNGGGTAPGASGPGASGSPGGAGGAGGPGGPGGRRGGAGGGNLLAAPDRMTLDQSGGKLRIQMRLPNGELATDEYTFGAKGTVSIGQNTAERNVGWSGSVLVIETKFKDGPSKEADYALDESGHLIMTTLVSGGHVKKTELKRVYDRVMPASTR